MINDNSVETGLLVGALGLRIWEVRHSMGNGSGIWSE